jgi:hypothetical protein
MLDKELAKETVEYVKYLYRMATPQYLSEKDVQSYTDKAIGAIELYCWKTGNYRSGIINWWNLNMRFKFKELLKAKRPTVGQEVTENAVAV